MSEMDLNMHNDVEFGFMLLFGIPSVRYLGHGTFTNYVFAFVMRRFGLHLWDAGAGVSPCDGLINTKYSACAGQGL